MRRGLRGTEHVPPGRSAARNADGVAGVSAPATPCMRHARPPPRPESRGYFFPCAARQLTTTVIGVLASPAVTRNRKRFPSGATS